LIPTYNETVASVNKPEKITPVNTTSSYNNKEQLSLAPRVYFCPKSNCEQIYLEELSKAKKSIDCAFYDLDLISISNLLINRSESIPVRIVVDNDYLTDNAIVAFLNTNVRLQSDIDRNTRYNNYMHHKFCIIDNSTILFGSTNPTKTDTLENNNNLVVMHSKLLAENFNFEFDQLYEGVFGTNKKNGPLYYNITQTFENQTYITSSYFCPEFDCGSVLSRELLSAKKSIHFMAFVLTENDFEEVLMSKVSLGVDVKGVIETRMWNTQGSKAENLSLLFPLKKDSSKDTMHHKVFIIDGETVITGSMNPTGSGVNYNDEHLVIIKNRDFAMKFESEFSSVFGS
jgi:phosphatidylserine/phosphatidylglycerophosphate/cardiolipin synthase-like enzyme